MFFEFLLMPMRCLYPLIKYILNLYEMITMNRLESKNTIFLLAPIGILPAAFLFGILYQGGSEVTFEMPNIARYMFVAVQGLIILFSGALENLFRPQIESFFVRRLNKEVNA